MDESPGCFDPDGGLMLYVHNERAVRVWRLDRLRRARADLGLDG